MKYIAIFSLLCTMWSCLKNNGESNKIYLNCHIDGKEWKAKGKGLFLNNCKLDLFIQNDTIKRLDIIGHIYKDDTDDYVTHERISMDIPMNISLQDLSLPITITNLPNMYGYYRNGFRTPSEVIAYSPPTEFQVIDFSTTNLSVTIESLTRYEA